MKQLFYFSILTVLAAGCNAGPSVSYTDVDPGSILKTPVDGILIRRFSIDTGERRKLSGYLFEPVKSGKGPGLLYLHWLGGTENVDQSALEFYPEAAQLASEGYVCAVPDGMFPWMAAPRGDERDLEYLETQDRENRLVLDLLSRHAKVGKGALGVVGHDYGGMHALLTATRDDRIGYAVVMTPVSEYWFWNRIITFMPEGEKLDSYKEMLSPYDPVRTVAKRRDIPLLLQYSNADEYVSRDDAERLSAAAGGNTETKWYPSTHEINRSAEATRDRLDWIRAQVR